MRFFIFSFILIGFSFKTFSQNSNSKNFLEIGIGDTSSFLLVDEKLQLNSITAGEKFLLNPVQISDSMIWEFSVDLNFSPSTSNQLKIYLLSNHSDLKSTTEALFLKIGKTGTTDGLEWYLMQNKKEVLLKNIAVGSLSKSVNKFKVKVIKLLDNWSLTYSNDTLIEQIDTVLVLDKTNAYFGFNCKFTLSNNKAFSFYQINFGPYLIDKSPPVLLSSKYDNKVLEFVYNEHLNGQILSLEFSPKIALFTTKIKGDTLSFIIKDTLQKNSKYSVNFTVEDNFGNSTNNSFSFWNYELESNDLIITEIMYKPENGMGILENVEYLELFNNSNRPINLSEILLEVDGKSISIPELILLQNSFVVLSENNLSFNKNYINNLVLNNWFTLLYGGSDLKIISKGNTIDHIKYLPDQLDNDFKNGGGWSLELKNLSHSCLGFKNWDYSLSEIGGTPGYSNSSFDEFVFNEISPEFLSIKNLIFLSDSSIKIKLNLAIEKPMLSFFKSDLNIKSIKFENGLSDELIVEFFDKMEEKHHYKFALQNDLFNCLNLPSDTTINYFAIPKLVINDLIINEILFNPNDNGSKFMEVFNNTENVLDLSSVKFASLDNEGKITYSYKLSDEKTLLFPNEYICYVENSKLLFLQHPQAKNVVQFPNWPTMNTTSGNLALIQPNGKIINQISYLDDWHFSELAFTKGVSLEKINPFLIGDIKENTKENWTSASYTENYATPGKQNSQYSVNDVFESNFYLSKSVFTPNNDGVGDVLEINYQLKENNTLCTICLYNSSGEFLIFLESNILLGKSGTIYWDGILENNKLIDSGLYILGVIGTFQETKPFEQKITFSVNR